MIAAARILVVGAGIAGLATARALAGAGFSVEVVEREGAWDGAGAGIYLPGNAAHALRTLGLERAVSERAVVIPRQRFCDHRGRLLVEVDLAEIWDNVGPCLALHRTDLHAVLIDGARDVPIRMAVDVCGLSEHNGTLTVEFGDGSTREYDIVVGADGIHSTVRRLAFGSEATARPVGQVGWRFVAPRPRAITTWTVMLGHRSAFLMLPIGHGCVYCYCDLVSGIAEEGDDDLERTFSGFAEPVLSLIDSVADRQLLHRATIEEVAMNSWVNGRVILVGDAAHATSPNMAEGAGMALEDALVLADCLNRRETVPAALSDFQTRRRPRTDWVLAQTHRRDRTRYLPTAARNVLLRAFGRRIFRSHYQPLSEPI